MKYIILILSGITIVFAALGLFRILPFNTAIPVMLTSLATLLLLRSIEYKNSRDKNGFLFTFLAAILIYVIIIYNVFIG